MGRLYQLSGIACDARNVLALTHAVCVSGLFSGYVCSASTLEKDASDGHREKNHDEEKDAHAAPGARAQQSDGHPGRRRATGDINAHPARACGCSFSFCHHPAGYFGVIRG